MNNSKKTSLIISSTIIGMVSGLLSAPIFNHETLFFDALYPTLHLILPGFLFGVAVCVAVHYVLKLKIKFFRYILFIIGSTISYFLAAFSTVFEYNPNGDISILHLAAASLIGGILITISFLLLKIKISWRGNVSLVIISILSSLTFQVPNDLNFSILLITWQGLMLGSLAYLVLKNQKAIV